MHQDHVGASADDHQDDGWRCEVDVRVLGPAEVRGSAGPFERAWSLELVVYLAMHPRGATSDEWATALWPDRLMASPTLYSIASAARRALGRSRSGADHLPRRHGRLQLSPSVGSDWQQLRVLAAGPATDDWERALSLVRGRPFEGLRDPDWAVLEGVLAEVEDGVVDLALRLAEHRLVAGDGRRAAWAARRGLLASPYDERLYRILLRAADLEGNPAGVEAAMAELVLLVAGGDGGCLVTGVRTPRTGHHLPTTVTDLVHPDTAALYRALSRRRTAASGRVVARL